MWLATEVRAFKPSRPWPEVLCVMEEARAGPSLHTMYKQLEDPQCVKYLPVDHSTYSKYSNTYGCGTARLASCSGSISTLTCIASDLLIGISGDDGAEAAGRPVAPSGQDIYISASNPPRYLPHGSSSIKARPKRCHCAATWIDLVPVPNPGTLCGNVSKN